MRAMTAVLALISCVAALRAAAQEPPASPPADWGPVVDDWPRIKARTLVIGGERDGQNYPAQARNVAAKVQNGGLVLIPSTGHNPHFESPDLLFPPLVRFLQGQDVGQRP